MSAYDSLPTSSYNLPPGNLDHGSLAQQQQQHHDGVSPAQPYQFDLQHQGHQAYNGEANGPSKAAQQLSGGAGGAEKPRWKGNRLRKACDSCSTRKVRCDESGPPCLACSALEIPCTFERPSRRRGPPNRHAEALKRRRYDTPLAPALFSRPTSPNNVAATLASFSSHAVLSADSICPFPILELLVDDFFTYIHPLVPFPHEPSFRMAFKHREDLNNPSFLALVAAMIGALVASFPRRPRLHLKDHNLESLFPSSVSLIDRCQKVAVEARGPGYLDKELTIYDACVSYFLVLIGAYTLSYKQSRLYLGETLTILRVIGAHKNRDDQAPSMGEPVDFIRQEIGRRIFWTVFVTARSMQQIGSSMYELIVVPPTPSEPYPSFPLEVDDQYIFVSNIDQQPEDEISQITGFNLNCKIYMACSALVTMEIAYGIDEIFDWNKQRRVIDDALRAVKQVFEGAPKEVSLAPGPLPGQFDGQSDIAYFGQPQGTGIQLGGDLQDGSRRHLQYEIQKANIYASHLGTRSYLVEKYWNLLDAYETKMERREGSSTSPIQTSPDVRSDTSATNMIEGYMSAERESIVKDLLNVLKSISQVNMEPNGGSFILKIRQIASTLLDTPRNRKGPLALKAEEYLAHFLNVLMKLERVAPSMGTDHASFGFAPREYRNVEEEEEEQLRTWADLRVFQARLVGSGDFLTEF